MNINKNGIQLFIAVFVFLAAWMIFIHLIGSLGAIRILYFYQVDKVVHFLGGFAVAGVLFRASRVRGENSFLLLIFIAILWEIFQWLVLPDVGDLYLRNYALWRKDTVFDFIIWMVGGVAALAAYKDNIKSGIST